MFAIRSICQSMRLAGASAFRRTITRSAFQTESIAAKPGFITSARGFTHSSLFASPTAVARKSATGTKGAKSTGTDGAAKKKKKSTTAGGSGTTKAKKSAVASKKTAKTGTKKSAAKPRTKKKEVSEERAVEIKDQKRREEIRTLVDTALLKEEPPRNALRVWPYYFSIQYKARKAEFGTVSEAMKTLARDFQDLPTSEVEKLQSEVDQHNVARKSAHDAWVKQHTPEQIRQANAARRSLATRSRLGTTGFVRFLQGNRFLAIPDDRQVKRPTNPMACYIAERFATGDGANRPASEFFKECAAEYRDLSPAEQQKYKAIAAAKREEYVKEYRRVYGHDAPVVPLRKDE